MISDSNSDLRVYIFAACTTANSSFNYQNYRILAEWLNVYTYILPNARKCILPQHWNPKTVQEVFNTYLALTFKESLLTEQEQWKLYNIHSPKS